MAIHNQQSQQSVRACPTDGHDSGNGYQRQSTGTSDTTELEREFQLLLDLLSNQPEIFLIY